MGVVALVSNCLIAPLLLGEKFRWRDALGVVIAIAGCVTVVLSASSSNPKLTPESIWHLITRWEFETYFGITLFLIIALSVASNRFGDRSILIDLGLVESIQSKHATGRSVRRELPWCAASQRMR